MEKYTALYARVSTEAQADQGYSIDAQKKMLEAYCVSRDIKRYRFYVDPGFSGSNLERPGIGELMNDIKKGFIESVVVYKLDRLSRSQKDTLYLIEDVFNPAQVGFVSLCENMDTSTPIGRAMLGIMSAFAQLERETIKQRTRMGMKERVKSGLWRGGGKVPFGYDYDKTSGTLVKNSDSDTVKKIYDLYLQGYSPASIAQKLGMKYDRIITQILKRETNTGVVPYKGEAYEGKHEALVDKDTFLRAQEEMLRRARGRVSGTHLLSGLIFCGECGARMRYEKWGNKGYKLVCYSTQKSKPYLVRDKNCPSERVWADEVEKYVVDDLFLMKIKKNKKESFASDKKTLEDKKRVLEKKLSRLYNLYADGDDSLIKVITDVKKELEVINERIKIAGHSQEEEKERERRIEEATGLKDVWDSLSVEEKKRIITGVVDKVVIYRDGIEIHYF